MTPSLWVAAQNGPYFVIGLELGAAKAFGLRLVWPNFRSQRRPPVYVDTPLGENRWPEAALSPAAAVL